VGTSTARSNLGNGSLTAGYQVEGVSNNNNRYKAHIYNAADVGAPTYIFAKSRGTSIGSNTIVQVDDQLGALTFEGADGTNFIRAASITALVDGTPGSNDMPGRLVFSTTADGASSPTERMRINNSGTTWIGATTSLTVAGRNQRLTVADDTSGRFVGGFVHSHATDPYGVGIKYSGASPNSIYLPFLYCEDSTALRAEIRSNGGLANYSANDVNLSDINAKKDIAPAAGTWDCLKEWEIVNFRYKEQSDDADLNLGVIAQQVAESCPEVITVFQEAKEATETEPAQEERLGVKEQQMMWMAIKALQEAQLRIETLEAEVAALKGA
jgi:hypothetical protein